MDFEREKVLSHLRRINEYDFEEFIAQVWNRYEWETEVTSGSNDRGIDVIAEKHKPINQKHLIQVKRWESGNKVGGPEIQQYSSLLRRGSGIDAVVVVTTSSFSRQAKELAEELNVKLVDGSDLYGLLCDIGADELVNQYIEISDLDAESKSGSDSRDDESNASAESDSLNLIFNEIEERIREHRSEVSNHKYNTNKSIQFSFLNRDHEVVELYLQYSAIYHNGAEFTIRAGQEIPEQAVEKVRNVESVDQAWMKSQHECGVSSSQGDVAPECHTVSLIIHRFCPGFSGDDKIYFDETVPDSEIPTGDESSGSEPNTPSHPQTKTGHSNRGDEFEIEKKFDDLR